MNSPDMPTDVAPPDSSPATADAPKAKRRLGWVGIALVVGAVWLVVLAVTGFIAYRRFNERDGQQRAEALRLGNEFMACLYEQDQACVKKLSTWDSETREKGMSAFRTFKKRLGTRRGAEPIADSWNWHSSTGSGGTEFKSTCRATYDHDERATETFTLWDEGSGMKVRHVNVNSDRFLPEPATDAAVGTAPPSTPAPAMTQPSQ